MSVTGRRWTVEEKQTEVLPGPFPSLIGQLLWNRGVRSSEESSQLLSTTPTKEHDYMLLPGIQAAINRFEQAIATGEIVAVFGDYDVDGITATALLSEGLQELGAKTLPYIPDRFSEGYGLSERALDRIASDGASLLVTVDCGTSSIREVAYANDLGLEVVILDHHSVQENLPKAIAIINPKRADSCYPETELTAVGLAYKMILALYESTGRSLDSSHYLDLVALGTVADVAPLVGENRSLVQRGLITLSKGGRAGLKALAEVARLPLERIDTEAISYLLAPRLNAAGRLSHASLALDLLLTKDDQEATLLAERLNKLNQQRQQQQQAALDLTAELLSSEDMSLPLIFIGHKSISAGIVGIVAGRIAAEKYRPTFVYERGAEQSRASGRSIPEYDITGALRSCNDLLLKFGGHHQAAGFTAKTAQLPALKDRLQEHAARELVAEELSPAIKIDAVLPLSHLQEEEIRWLAKLQPFGEGNPEPTFLSRNVCVIDSTRVGGNGAHLRLKLKDGPITWPAIAFRLGPSAPRPGQRLDIVYSLGANRLDHKRLELRIKDFEATTTA